MAETILTLLIGFVVGWVACGYRIRTRIQRIMSRLEEEQEDDTISVRLEKSGDSILVYNKQTEAFITQVRSKQEFFDYCQKNYEGKIVFMLQADSQLLDTL